MATLADVLRNYAPPTDSALADPIKEHFRTLPQQLATNQAALDSAIGSWNKTDFGTGLPNPNYRPEAIQELTQLMPNIGGLTAWHGTPHKIQGQFDINKVGTGEGNQSYGHGMYFAEAPAVATQYRDALSDFDWKFGGKPYDINNPSHRAAIELKQLGGNVAKEETIKRYENNIADLESRGVDWAKNAAQKKKEELAVLKTGVLPQLEEISKGNLYKVDIPDKDIPNMLDWDKPLNKQSELVQNVAKDLLPKIKQVSPNLDINKMTGKDFYRSYQNYRGNHPDFASEGLNEAGIKGIRYLDQGSRTPGFSSLTPTQLQSRIELLKTDIKSGAGNTQKMKDQLKGLQNELNSYSNMTSNFVVFDPSTVKILEENAKPVSRKEIIEKQIKSLKE